LPLACVSVVSGRSKEERPATPSLFSSGERLQRVAICQFTRSDAVGANSGTSVRFPVLHLLLFKCIYYGRQVESRRKWRETEDRSMSSTCRSGRVAGGVRDGK
jgi:hypothetical protein